MKVDNRPDIEIGIVACTMPDGRVQLRLRTVDVHGQPLTMQRWENKSGRFDAHEVDLISAVVAQLVVDAITIRYGIQGLLEPMCVPLTHKGV